MYRQHKHSSDGSKKDLHKRAKFHNHHIFAMRCRDEGVVPPSQRIKPPIRTKNAFKIAERASRAFLVERIRNTFRREKELKEEVTRRKRELAGILSPEDFRKVDRLSANTAELHLQQDKAPTQGKTREADQAQNIQP